MPGICGRKRTLAERRCPFLALWMQQGPANDSKDRHKAKMENHWSLRERRPHPATLGKSPQTARLTLLFRLLTGVSRSSVLAETLDVPSTETSSR
jgi:hypothetical protein